MPNAFIESLTHDSIIVQIPRLHGKINNRLDEILSIFDQTYKNRDNQHVLNLNDSYYAEDDVEMQRILRRLLIAAADADMRMDMNVEDEYFSIIESRDTDIMMKNRELAESAAKLKESNQKLEESNQKLEKSNKALQKSIDMLKQAGLSPEEIASSLGIVLED